MKLYRYLFFFVFSSISVFSQEKCIEHTISKGETISEIAKYYNVKPSEIYALNPEAKNGIKYKGILLIPAKTPKNTVKEESGNNLLDTHEVLPKETVYGIAKQYHITIDALYKINPDLEKEGLKIGQKINVPKSSSDNLPLDKNPDKSTEIEKPSQKQVSNEVVIAPKEEGKKEDLNGTTIHEVLPKESLYSISKQYGITVADIQNANPIAVTETLKIGQKLIIPVKDANPNLVIEKEAVKKAEKTETTVQPKVIAVKKEIESGTIHEVLPKESLYSISKLYGVSIAELQKSNPIVITETLKIGQKISIPVKSSTESNAPKIIVEQKNPETVISHEVLPKETKYGIAKQYGLTVAELEQQNPNIVKNLLVGSVLKIRSSKTIEVKSPVDVVVVKEESEKKEVLVGDTNNKGYNVELVGKLISTASERIGTRYRSGGTTTDGFDCSGLMYFTFSTNDIKLPRSSFEMATYGVKIDNEQAQKGDLIFFKTNGSGRINHVGLVVEVLDNEIKFIHSSTSSGVIISSTKESYYEKNLVQVNRVL